MKQQRRQRGLERERKLSHFSPSTPNPAATATGWSTSESWRAAVSTASGTSPSAPSTAWWTSTEPTASPWRRSSASETLPHHPHTCRPTPDATPTLTLTRAALRSPSPHPVSTLTRREKQLRRYGQSSSYY